MSVAYCSWDSLDRSGLSATDSRPSKAAPLTFHCDRCARCCQTHRVPVTQGDVERLVGTGREVAHFIELLPPTELDLTGEPETLAALPVGPRLPVLAHSESGCVFLGPPQAGTRSCLVHDSRPLSCRTYPFDRPDLPAEQPDRPNLDLHPAALCPEETGFLRVLASSAQGSHAQQVKHRDDDLRQHAEFIATWNRRQRMRRALGKARKTEGDFLQALAAPARSAKCSPR